MKIKNHEILHEISRGALTTVYKARHLNLDRLVLLKVLNKQWLNQKDLLERFRREAKISGRLKHPNIVNVYDFEISRDLVYISMEYVEGQTLDQFIKQQKNIPWNTFLQIFTDLLSALQYAHENGVIHRDIKPSNILLDKGLTARLTDFGLASLQDIPAITEQGQSLGTPAYMAPEQIMGNSCDERTDLYSFGITIIEMLNGQSPFQKENTAATLQSVLNDPLPEILVTRCDIPTEFLKLIHSLVLKEKTERPKNAAVLLRQLGSPDNPESVNSIAVKNKSKRPVLKPVVYVTLILICTYFILHLIGQNFLVKNSNVNQNMEDTTKLSEKKLPILIDSVETKAPEEDSARLSTEKNNITPPAERKTQAKQKNKIETIPEDGKLFIVGTPWAIVKINGDSIDTTPLKRSITLASGDYSLELSNPNHKSVRHQLQIQGGMEDTLYFQLEPAFGYLMVQVTPWAQLFINDSYKEDTPIQKPLLLPAGKSILKLKNPSLGTITDTIFIEAGKTIEKHFTFIN